ncbi:hypothetical protein EIP91_004803 [Steccherinum ochraceum]|uniref:NAD-dependent epimerase/dehydratase domain-containing protein n=1 Tax=Steccherinum ochraceum TaxID=92696 RepID=A0A4R0RNG8_9APHY|nr:hypothetical protein EIP91_004803 [Steccherinum ochraceum]
MATTNAQLVLVTGVSGYLGSHVVDQLVHAGYRVRGVVRSAKIAANKEAFSIYKDAVEIYGIDDLVSGVFPEAFEDVHDVIHVAAPLVGRAASAEEAFTVAVEGSLNILRQAEKAGVKHFSFASSIVAVSTGFLAGDFNKINEDQWCEVDKEGILNNKNTDPVTIYIAEKVLSELAVWEFADRHPHIEVTAVNPPYFYGPFAPGYKAYVGNSTISNSIFSTMVHLYSLITPKDDFNSPVPYFVDVRDVARALVAGALTSPPTSQVGRKRILLSGEWVQPAEIVELVETTRPALKGRLNEEFKKNPGGLKQIVDNKRLGEVLGLRVTPWKKTFLDGIDDLLRVEEEWKKAGLTPKYPDTI